MGYDVFIERAQNAAPGSDRHLAEAIADRYGMAADAITSRLARGRFRVKSDVDRDTARQFATDLEALGAVCSVIESGRTPPVARTSVGNPNAPRRVSARRAANQPPPDPPPPPAARPPAPVTPSAPTIAVQSGDDTTDSYESGLAAAFTANNDPTSLGALENFAPEALTLASVDGVDQERGAAPVSLDVAVAPQGDPRFPPPPVAARPPEPAAPPPPPSSGADLFAPPDAEVDDLALAVDVAPRPSAPDIAVPPASDVPDVDVGMLVPASEGVEPRGESLVDRLRTTFVDNARSRFASGVFLAVLLGFVPAHIYASLAESSSFDEIRGEVRQSYDEVTSEEDWELLDDVRDGAYESMSSRRSNIVLMSCLIWGVAGAGLGFVWFRKIPWDRLVR